MMPVVAIDRVLNMCIWGLGVTSDQGQAHPLVDTLSPGLIRASLEELSTQGGTRREGRTHYNKTDWLQV